MGLCPGARSALVVVGAPMLSPKDFYFLAAPASPPPEATPAAGPALCCFDAVVKVVDGGLSRRTRFDGGPGAGQRRDDIWKGRIGDEGWRQIDGGRRRCSCAIRPAEKIVFEVVFVS